MKNICLILMKILKSLIKSKSFLVLNISDREIKEIIKSSKGLDIELLPLFTIAFNENFDPFCLNPRPRNV